jgi:hypothetical protein
MYISIQLARKLKQMLAGSEAVEVAMKLACQYHLEKQPRNHSEPCFSRATRATTVPPWGLWHYQAR